MTQQKELVQNKTPEVTKSKKEKWLLFFCYLFLLSLSGVLPDGSNFSLALRAFRSFTCGFGTTAACFPLCGRSPDPKDFSENRPCCPFGNLRLPLACFSHRYHFQRPIPNPDFLLKKHPVRGAFCLLKFQIVFFDPTDLAQQKAECKAEKCRQNETDEK